MAPFRWLVSGRHGCASTTAWPPWRHAGSKRLDVDPGHHRSGAGAPGGSDSRVPRPRSSAQARDASSCSRDLKKPCRTATGARRIRLSRQAHGTGADGALQGARHQSVCGVPADAAPGALLPGAVPGAVRASPLQPRRGRTRQRWTPRRWSSSMPPPFSVLRCPRPSFMAAVTAGAVALLAVGMIVVMPPARCCAACCPLQGAAWQCPGSGRAAATAPAVCPASGVRRGRGVLPSRSAGVLDGSNPGPWPSSW